MMMVVGPRRAEQKHGLRAPLSRDAERKDGLTSHWNGLVVSSLPPFVADIAPVSLCLLAPGRGGRAKKRSTWDFENGGYGRTEDQRSKSKITIRNVADCRRGILENADRQCLKIMLE